MISHRLGLGGSSHAAAEAASSNKSTAADCETHVSSKPLMINEPCGLILKGQGATSSALENAEAG
jgi:hypothetical protein